MKYDFNLDLYPTDYYEAKEIDALASRHHLSTNSTLFKIKNNGNISLFGKNFVNLPSYIEGEKSHILRENEINRFDLISWKYYKTPELFWVIMAVNNIINPFDVKENLVLRIIPLSYIEYALLRYNNE